MDGTPVSLIGALAQSGPLGIIIGLLVYWVYLKDKQLTAERDARVADAKAFTDLALKLQSDAISSVNKLSDVFEEIQKLQSPQSIKPYQRPR